MSKQADSLGFEQDAKPENVVWHRHAVDKAQRATLKQQRPAVLVHAADVGRLHLADGPVHEPPS